MSDVLWPSRSFRRLRLTPTRDLLRGRITGRLDWRAKIRAAGLPEAAESVVLQVVTRTRLWRAEKVAVADELIAHFADGLASGASADDVARAFGDPRRAAKLIGCAKRRGRALPWHALVVAVKIFLLLIGLYIALGIYFYVGRPTPTIDYLGAINQRILAVPPADRAWPLYRRAILMLTDRPNPRERWPKVIGYNFYGKHWPEITVWLRAHNAGLALAREASTKPSFGFVLGRGGSEDDPALGWDFHRYDGMNWSTTAMEGSLYMTLNPYWQDARTLSQVLAADAKLASEGGDAARFEADIEAMLGLAAQLKDQEGVGMEGTISLSIRAEAQGQVAATLRDHPLLLDDARLAHLAHRLSGPNVAADLVNISNERAESLDLIQRAYTDDGHGDGRLTLAGLRMLREEHGIRLWNEGPSDEDLMLWYYKVAAAPVTQLIALSRRQLVDTFNANFDRQEADLHRPIREMDVRRHFREIGAWSRTPVDRVRYAMLQLTTTSLHGIATTAERVLGQRDGVVVGIALELYHRRHGRYPELLEQLTPDLLPAVPLDRITGDPVRYRVVDGKPLVYSVGADRHDDGGVLNPNNPLWAAQWHPNDVRKGDWVLYPEPVPTVSDNEE